MATKDSEDVVYFLNPDGTRFSNDPRWVAAQAAGQAFPDNSTLAAESAEDENPVDEESKDDSVYDGMSGKELKAEVEQRNEGRDDADKISLSGVTKKSEIVALLKADDEKADEA